MRAPDTLATAALQVQQLSVDIPAAGGVLHAVSGVDFHVDPGETFALVGESGCGKTLTALSIMRLLPPGARMSATRMLLADQDLLSLDEHAYSRIRGERISMIFQDPMSALDPVFTIGSQLEEVYRAHRRASRAEARERAEFLLERLGIASPRARLDQYPHQLSGGLRQRILIAMAVLCDPSMIIADEPTTALDVTVQAQILHLLAGLQRELGLALLLITHDLGIVARMARRMAVMYAGRIVEAGTVEQVLGNPRHPYTQQLLECVPQPGKRERLGFIPGSVPSLIGPSSGCSFHGRCARALARCANEETPVREDAGHSFRCLLP